MIHYSSTATGSWFRTAKQYRDRQHLLENTLDRKRISTNPKPNPNRKPEVKYCIVFGLTNDVSSV